MLAVLLALAAVAPSPTSGRCAGAWNASGPAGVRAIVKAGHVRRATVENTIVTQSVDSWGGGRQSSTQTSSPGCVVSFFLSARTTLTLHATWHDGRVVDWGRPVRFTSPAVPGSGNACVAADGTIHRVGRFDARSRC